jgi:hypothetical protein
VPVFMFCTLAIVVFGSAGTSRQAMVVSIS